MGVGDSICPNLKLPLKQSRLPFAVGMHCGVALVFEGCISPGLAAPDPFTGLAWAPLWQVACQPGFVDLFRELGELPADAEVKPCCHGQRLETGTPAQHGGGLGYGKHSSACFGAHCFKLWPRLVRFQQMDINQPRKSRRQASLVQCRYVAEPRWGAHPVRLSGDFSARDANKTAEPSVGSEAETCHSAGRSPSPGAQIGVLSSSADVAVVVLEVELENPRPRSSPGRGWSWAQGGAMCQNRGTLQMLLFFFGGGGEGFPVAGSIPFFEPPQT